MTIKQIEAVRKLKIGDIIEIGAVTIKRDRGQWSVQKGKFIKIYKDTDFPIMSDKIDELNTEKSTEKPLSYEIPGTKIIVIKTPAGYELWESGKLIQRNMTDDEVETYLTGYKKKQEIEKTIKARKEIVTGHKISRQRKVLYYFILLLSVILLITTYVLGIKFDGVTISRNNRDLHDVINVLAETKYPEKRFNKFDAVYYTLNYYAHEDNYFMVETNIEELPVLVESQLYLSYTNNLLSYDLSDDATYSGYEFNLYFKNELGRYVDEIETIRRIGYILGANNITSIEELKTAYLVWDENDVKSNRAYNWEVINPDGTRPFNYNVTYYTTYLARNNFIKLFLNDGSKFINEYNLFESVGWLSWSSLVVLFLYLILAFSIWVFRKDNLKISKGLITIIMVLTAIIMVPLIFQYFFEGLRKDATQFLDVLENTRFTTTTVFMNFVFDYILKFSSIVLTGILTIALPLKVVRYFVFNAINKLDNGSGKISKAIGSGVTITQDLDKAGWRM